MNSLGIDKAPADTRVVVAMSGGVDSSVVAAELKAEGYDVIGVTLQLYDHGAFAMKKGACCAGQDIYDARRVADRIDAPHYVLDYEGRFSQSVIDDFADSYIRGETPIPCVRCNQQVKFRDLLDAAKDLGADVMATGHYARRVRGAAGPELHRGADPARDQSYFLFATTAEQLDFLRFPLGGLPKTETRKLAEKHGLAVADKPDSQDICFVPNGDYAGVVEKLRPGALAPGDIVHIDGRVMGRHDGIIRYTIGQRKGLGVGGVRGGDGEPLYVVGLDAPTRRVMVGPRSALGRSVVRLKDVNWPSPDLADAARAGGLRAEIKLRSAQAAAPCTVRLLDGDAAEITLDEAQYGVAPGQAGVLYMGERLLGGGWIASAA